MEFWTEICKKHGKVGGTLRFLNRLVRGCYRTNQSRKLKFEKFIYQIMPLSLKAYHSAEEMQNMDYDAILFGSDQIWNSRLTDGIATEYIGGFACLEKTKKIAYAASCGRSQLTEEERTYYYPLLKSFTAVGVREQGLCESLREDGFAAQTVLDPTLLLTKEQWSQLIGKRKHRIKRPKRDYLLVYVFDEDPAVYGLVDQIAEKCGLEVCVIAYQTKSEIEKYRVYDNCGPQDFLELIAGASKIVTTSFHGTVFSILFEKEFYCIPHPTLHERTDSLLSLLSLGERNCCPETDTEAIPKPNWDQIRSKLNMLRDESLEFLKEALQ